MKKFFKGLLIVLLIAAAGFGYWLYRTNKPMVIHGGVNFVDLLNHVGFDSDYQSKSKLNADGTRTIQYEVVEDQVFKIPYKPGYPKRIKLYKFYTLTLYFDADGYSTGWKIKENPNSPLLGKDRR